MALILGVIGTLATERLRDARLQEREDTARRIARTQLLQDRRDDFELNILRATFASLTRVARASTRWHLLDRQAAIATKSPYASHQLPGSDADEIGQEHLLAVQEAHANGILVLDNEIRALVSTALAGLSAVAVGPKSVAEAEREWDHATARVDAAQVAIATRIRTLYGPSET